MKKLTRIILALAALSGLRACAGLETALSGKEVTVSMGDDGKPALGFKFGK